MDSRTYPKNNVSKKSPDKPISFIVVRFSNEITHNFYCSESIYNTVNEVIEVNNTANLFFDNLSQAILHGIKQASYNLIAIVHEDVLLPPGWQQTVENSLTELEIHDPNWGLLGSIGWDNKGKMTGHCSDPHGYHYHFSEKQPFYEEVERLDEQLLIVHKERLPDFDINLPGIHHIGQDLAFNLKKSGRRTYAIEAPTIHKYADSEGALILQRKESPKIVDRESFTYKADKACCNDYIMKKWPSLQINDIPQSPLTLNDSNTEKCQQLSSPIIFLSRGGSGSRLLSLMAQDLGIFTGNNVNISGDCIDLVLPIYQGIVEKYRCNSLWQKEQIVPRLKSACMEMIKDIPVTTKWGFKLPESIFILPEIQEAFPNARYVHFLRDPLTTCLRRTHMTARLDNHIGRITLPLAYQHLKIDCANITNDSSVVKMLYTTIHQLELIENHIYDLKQENKALELRFEQTLLKPQEQMILFSNWLNAPRAHYNLEHTINKDRAATRLSNYSKEIISFSEKALKKTRKYYNYI